MSPRDWGSRGGFLAGRTQHIFTVTRASLLKPVRCVLSGRHLNLLEFQYFKGPRLNIPEEGIHFQAKPLVE